MERPMKAYIGAAVERYWRLAARTPGSRVKMSTHRSGNTAITVATIPTDRNATQPATSAIRRARATRCADRHPYHRHRGDPDREGDRGQHELKPGADAIAGQHLGSELR